jgi:hypothetical protein
VYRPGRITRVREFAIRLCTETLSDTVKGLDLLKGFNPLNSELSPIYHLLALLGAHHILHVSRVRVNVYG